jgi:Ca-activated chloride channel homolog
MFRPRLWRASLLAGLTWLLAMPSAIAQFYSAPGAVDSLAGELTSLRALQSARMDPAIFQFNTEHTSPLQDRSNSVSKLDLAAPKNARKEFDIGYLLMSRRQFPGAIEHLSRAISIYPNFVAGHNALGIVYLNAGQIQLAHGEFVRAVALDDHLPGSYLNLGCSQMQLERYAEAEETLKKAASLAPMDRAMARALTYAQFKNQDYSGVITTTRRVHHQKHEGAALVHLFAAGAWEAQDRLGEAQDELETLLSEDPKSPLAGQVRKILDQMKVPQVSRTRMKQPPVDAARAEPGTPSVRNAESPAAQMRPAPQEIGAASEANFGPEQADANVAHQVIRVAVEEVAMLFGVTDHGKAVTDLTASNVKILDDGKPPDAVLSFHNVTQLPLRIGLIIDISNSITERFAFEMTAASKFLDTVVTGKDDLSFVVAFNCSVLLPQDFTPNKALTAHALSQLAPGGGTALWDAVAFAADKLANHPESEPAARILVVISDGEDNSSSVSLQQVIWRAQRDEVAVYTVSTKEGPHEESNPLMGNRGLKKLSEETGGSAFTSGSLSDIGKRLADLQQVLRGRYLVYYSPASHQPDGRYHAVEIKAEKDGHHLKVIARKGYYASALLDAGIQ